MAKPFTKIDAYRIIDEHNKIIDKLEDIKLLSEKFRIDVEKAAEAFLAKEVITALKDIPVEEINRGKQGFRIKALREYGYKTIADIATSSVYSLSSVYGISDDSAYSIKKITNDIVSQKKQEMKIRLSTDNKSKESSQLVLALYKYSNMKNISKQSKKLLNENLNKILYAQEDITTVSGNLKWLFGSKLKKEKAVAGYSFLTDLIKADYGKEAKEIIDVTDALYESEFHEAWKSFEENSIKFFNELEEIVPGALGNDDSIYGLPEELAKEIHEECFFPEGLLCELRRYQEWGVKYTLHQERVLLGDEMGLGKTIQAIATMVSLRNTGGTHFLVVCPASIVTNWCREIRKKSMLSVTKVHGKDKKSAIKEWIKLGGVAVTTYETTKHFELSENFKFELLIVDEAHYIKNSKANRSINVKNIGNHSNRLLFMTGTPIENNVEEMISLIDILQPQVASKLASISNMPYAAQFRNEIAPVYYRRKREEVLTELPELIENEEWCKMSYLEEEIYEESALDRKYAGLRRLSWNVDDLKNSSKAKRLLEIIDEVKAENRKIIVFSFFLDTIHKIAEFLGDICTNPITGSVTPKRRQEIIDEFDKAPAGAVLLAQIQAGGTGLNIQSASVIVICEPQFKPSIEKQAISRAYRMGQTRNVLVYRLLCEETIEEKMMNRLKEKQDVFNAFADKSVAAAKDKEIDSITFKEIINEEIERINAKRSKSTEE